MRKYLSVTWTLSAIAAGASLLAACSGGNPVANNSDQNTASAEPSLTELTLIAEDNAPIDAATLSDMASTSVKPNFHVVPVVLPAPSDADQQSPNTSARQAPAAFSLTASIRSQATQRATPNLADGLAVPLGASSAKGVVPSAAPSAFYTYTPAQIRAAYKMPPLPDTWSGLTPAQLASYGAGQTIYIVDAYHNPNIADELSEFNRKFGLPQCNTKNLSVTQAFPLPSAPVASCEFSIAYVTSSGNLSSTPPVYNASWATEIAMDVQWAHATAPLARIVLLEGADSSVTALNAAVAVANKMGRGVVSMSYGAAEGTWSPSADGVYSAPGMTYFSSTGDNGMQLNWPATSSKVVAVGGTSLTYNGTGSRAETVWSGTGGGISKVYPIPSYQSNFSGKVSAVNRVAADVSLNADPYTGQFIVQKAGTGYNWMSGGGTSISAPQWAATWAIVNAKRAIANASPLDAAPFMYQSIGSNALLYSAVFSDIVSGTHGTCGTCSAKSGYDEASGLGTPNVTSLLSATDVSSPTIAPPTISGASVSGVAGTALSFTLPYKASVPVGFMLSGAPAGMSVNADGVVTWQNPVAGNYAITATVKNINGGAAASASYQVAIKPATPPVLQAFSLNGTVGTPLSGKLTYTSANPVSFTLSGHPAGMTITSAGVLSWSVPSVGTYTIYVTAKDVKTGASATIAGSVKISPATPPTFPGKTISVIVGTTMNAQATASGNNASSFVYAGVNLPAGMSISPSGVMTWKPLNTGTYVAQLMVRDTKTGASSYASYTVSVIPDPAGIRISAPAVSGSPGKAISGFIPVTGTIPGRVTYTISGAPAGLIYQLTPDGLSFNWTKPTAGTFSVKISVSDAPTRVATAAHVLSVR